MSLQSHQTYEEERPWGGFITFTKNSPCTVKIITVKKGEAFSLQYHKSRDEFWYILSGTGKATVGKEILGIEKGKQYFIPRETLHRIEAGNEDVVFLEVSSGTFDEKDIVRVEDRYNRVS